VDVSPIISGLLGAVVALPIMGLLLWSGKRKTAKPDSEGWTVLNNTVGLHILATLFAICLALFLVVTGVSLYNEFLLGNDSPRGLLFLGPPLVVLFGFGVYGIWGVRCRFNKQGIVYRAPFKSLFVEWHQIDKLVESNSLGTYLTTSHGRLWISKYRHGFSELLAELCRHDIPGAEKLAWYEFSDDE